MRYFGTLELGILEEDFFLLLNSFGQTCSSEKKIIWQKFYFHLPCRTSPRRCFRGSPGGWSWISFLQNLYINTKGRFNKKNYDDWFVNSGDNRFFNLSRKKRVIEVWATKIMFFSGPVTQYWIFLNFSQRSARV